MKRLLQLLALALSSVAAHAVTLDWNSVDWTANSLSQSFDVDASNPGNDITITISGDTGDRSGTTPDDTTAITGGFSGQQSLYLAVNYDSPGSNEITVTIQFHYTSGVNNVQFTIFDLDRDSGNWRDRIDQLEGSRSGSATSNADLSGTNYHDIYNNGTATAYAEGDGPNEDAGPTTNDANLDVTFNDGTMDTVSFRWTNQDSALDFQYIGISDITWTPAVPEPSTYAAGLLLSVLVIYTCLKRQERSTA